MKKIYHYFLFFFLATNAVAAEKLDPTGSSHNEKHLSGDISSPVLGPLPLSSTQTSDGSGDPQADTVQAQADLIRSLDLTTNTLTIADAPIDIFFQERGLVRMAFLN